MEEIIKVLLLEGIDEATIHKVLDVIDEKITQGKRWTAAVKSLEGREKELKAAREKYFSAPFEKRSVEDAKKFDRANIRHEKAKGLANSRGYGGYVSGSSSEVKDKGDGYKEYTSSVLYGPMSREKAKGQPWTEDMGSYEKKLADNAKKKNK